jgi:hypothetical protein
MITHLDLNPLEALDLNNIRKFQRLENRRPTNSIRMFEVEAQLERAERKRDFDLSCSSVHFPTITKRFSVTVTYCLQPLTSPQKLNVPRQPALAIIRTRKHLYTHNRVQAPLPQPLPHNIHIGVAIHVERRIPHKHGGCDASFGFVGEAHGRHTVFQMCDAVLLGARGVCIDAVGKRRGVVRQDCVEVDLFAEFEGEAWEGVEGWWG